jgi:hypothetical protein
MVNAVEPISKKPKLEPNGHAPLNKQQSFSEVLQQLEAEEDVKGGEWHSSLHPPLA